jgi:hypothetical protein
MDSSGSEYREDEKSCAHGSEVSISMGEGIGKFD